MEMRKKTRQVPKMAPPEEGAMPVKRTVSPGVKCR
jgi:hypothetical protein